jgi:hypothetical protein
LFNVFELIETGPSDGEIVGRQWSLLLFAETERARDSGQLSRGRGVDGRGIIPEYAVSEIFRQFRETLASLLPAVL